VPPRWAQFDRALAKVFAAIDEKLLNGGPQWKRRCHRQARLLDPDIDRGSLPRSGS
jgi:hypothetical protein